MPVPASKKMTDASQRIGKTPRQLYRWQAAGCDLDDPQSVQEFSERLGAHAQGRARVEAIAKQKPLEFKGGTLQAMADANSRRQEQAKELDISDLPETTGQGAAAALKRLQEFEARFASRLLAALDSNRADVIQVARDDYTKCANSLRQYEREVEVTKRDLGHLIPKREAEAGARAAAIWFRLAWRMWLSSTLPSLMAIGTDPRAIKMEAERSFADILGVALKNAAGAQLSIPEWADQVIRDEWHLAPLCG